jgi:hypothetical protein
MLIEKKSPNITAQNIDRSLDVSVQEVAKLNLIVDEKYTLKDIHEIETRFLLKVGIGISYSIMFAFLVFKLLA